ncbi:MAG TPA: thioredoxin domain-containing protein [Nannocystaceae bacterium]|nr:thioredoxin domain-containing protein [Nannocystaceae bacterium]
MSKRYVRHSWLVIAIGAAACDQPVDPAEARLGEIHECEGDCEGKPGEAPSVTDERKVVAVAGYPSRGPDDAPVTIVAFSDFECPFCIRGANNLEKVVASHPGKVRVVFRNMPLPMHAGAEPAAIAALAAHRQGKFWEMHDALFATQGKFAVDDLDALADEIGLDMTRYRSDIADPALAAALKRDVDEAKRLGVTGTPSFFVNGRLVVGARPADELTTLVAEEAAAAERFVANHGGRDDPYAALQATL